MTRRHSLFIETYSKLLNATQSAKIAGYSERTAYSSGQRLLKQVEIKKAIDERIKEISKEYNLDKDTYVKRTLENWRDAKHPSVKQRYWELVGKALGHFTEKMQIEHTLPTPQKSDRLLGDLHIN